MKTVTLHIPGDFEDAYVYMGWVVALSAERTFRFYSLDEIVSAISGIAPQSAYVADLMFRHNEWLTSPQFKAFTTSGDTRQTIESQFDAFPRPYLEIPRNVNFTESDVRVGSNVILDYLIYNRQLYVGSKDGLFSARAEWGGDVPFLEGNFNKTLDARCLSVTGRFGAIVASCGDDGLLWSPETSLSSASESIQWRKAEDRSIRARWLSADIVNYRTRTDPDFLSIKRTRSQERGAEDSDLVVSAIGEQRASLQQLLKQIEEHSFRLFDYDLIQYVFNSEKMVFVYTVDGHFFALDVLKPKRDLLIPQLNFSHTYKGPGVKIISAAAMKFGAAVETDSRVFHFAHGYWTTIVDRPALSVRTFPQSKAFQNLVATTTEDGIFLVGLYDETLRLPIM